MSNGLPTSFSKSLSVLTHRGVYHSLFWLFYTVATFAINWQDQATWSFALVSTLINVLFLVPVVYVNFYMLMPNYLSEKRFLNYFMFLIGLCFLVTPLKVFVLYLRAHGDIEMQTQIKANQVGYFLQTLILVTFATVLKIIAEWIRQQRVRQDLERDKLQSELRFLKMQINPHFLFNTLNSIYALTLKKSDDAPDTVLRLSEMMRYMLYDCNERTVLLEKEITYIEHYIALEQIRHGKKASVIFDIQGDVQSVEIAPMLLIVFVENAFKHGLSQHLTHGFIRINLNVKEQNLLFTVENSKTALHDASYHQGGIGLQNTRRRLSILYPEKHRLSVLDGSDTYRVVLEVLL